MADNQSDFYRIQDRLLVAWRLADADPTSETEFELLALNRELEDELLELNDDSPEIARVLTLLNHKIELLLSSDVEGSDVSTNLGGFCDKAHVDVSLSGSGMGYFSLTNAEEGAKIIEESGLNVTSAVVLKDAAQRVKEALN